MKCRNCDSLIEKGQRYCSQCGYNNNNIWRISAIISSILLVGYFNIIDFSNIDSSFFIILFILIFIIVLGFFQDIKQLSLYKRKKKILNLICFISTLTSCFSGLMVIVNFLSPKSCSPVWPCVFRYSLQVEIIGIIGFIISLSVLLMSTSKIKELSNKVPEFPNEQDKMK